MQVSRASCEIGSGSAIFLQIDLSQLEPDNSVSFQRGVYIFSSPLLSRSLPHSPPMEKGKSAANEIASSLEDLHLKSRPKSTPVASPFDSFGESRVFPVNPILFFFLDLIGIFLSPWILGVLDCSILMPFYVF